MLCTLVYVSICNDVCIRFRVHSSFCEFRLWMQIWIISMYVLDLLSFFKDMDAFTEARCNSY